MTVRTRRYTPTDRRLGRHVEHDDRSRDFAVGADESAIVSVRHERWAPVFDQGQVGSCTANAALGCLGTTGAWPKAKGPRRLTGDAAHDETVCVRLYSAEQRLLFGEPYPPSDQGGSGLAIAKILHRRGLIPAYRHAFGLTAALTALAAQPVIIGIPWYSAMFEPAADGRLTVAGSVAGGHEIVLDEIDTKASTVWLTNSWGSGWGVEGRAYLTWDDFGDLLADDGDCTVFDKEA